MSRKKIKIACVGDSITHGYASSNPDTASYPSVLKDLMGDGYEIGNFGLSGSTMMPDTFFPYYGSEEHKAALMFGADAVVLMLGTNDSCFYPDRAKKEDYLKAADKMFESFEILKKRPRIFFCLVPHLYSNPQFANSIETIIIPLQEQIAKKHGAVLIDVHSVLSAPSLFIDGVHPTDEGYALLAKTVAPVLKDAFGKK
ncbi:MAG: hypothetical protein E7623_05045 [Ruminococcaceae bacterium]|nr:hypothetical protein [Oscillospiraceae bacterium]